MEYPTQNANLDTPQSDFQRIVNSLRDTNSEFSRLTHILGRSAETLKAMPLTEKVSSPMPKQEPNSITDHFWLQIEEANSTIALLWSIVTHLQDTIGTK